MFLHTVQFTEFADTVTTLLLHVNSYQMDYDNGYLPPHLCLHGLATSIHQTTQSWLRDVISPRVRRVLEDDDFLDGRDSLNNLPRVQGVPRVNWMNRDNKQASDDHTWGRGRGNPWVGNRHNVPHRSCPSPSEGTPARGHGCFPHGPGRLARPDCNRRLFLPDVQCAACKQVGHVAKHCDMLATAICLEWYMKHDISPTICDSIEKEWLDRWRERLGHPTNTPRQVMCAYVEELDITVAGLDDQMEWDTWEDDDADDLQVE
jgi:hypothetical protein